MVNPINQPNQGLQQVNAQNVSNASDKFINSSSVSSTVNNDQVLNRLHGNIDSNTQVVDVFQSQSSKEELIKQVEKMISQKEDELNKINSEIQRLLSNPSTINTDPNLQKYIQQSNQIILDNLNLQKQAITNQLQILNQRKQELIKEKGQEEKNIQQLQERIKNNYQISIDQLNFLKKQLESYQKSINLNYQKQIEMLNEQIIKIQKEIEELFSLQPSTPEEAEEIAQKIAEKRNLINTLKGQIDALSQEISNLNLELNQQIYQLDKQITEAKKLSQVELYNKWADEQTIRREIEQIIWTEMLNEKNHIANMWKMYYDTNQKISQMWKDIYFKKIQDNNDFVARWTKALGA